MCDFHAIGLDNPINRPIFAVQWERTAHTCPGRSPKTVEPELPRVSKGRPGRIASLFRLNRDKYAQMKEDGGKTEF